MNIDDKNTEKFWSKVSILGSDDCWEWQGSRSPYGYGYMYVSSEKKIGIAHRISYELKNGKIEPGLLVLHKCDNPPCVNPDHLLLGTHADNARDMVIKGRKYINSHGVPSPRILTGEIVLEICNELDSDVRETDLASKYGVDVITISNINTGKTWSSVTGRNGSNKKNRTGMPVPRSQGENHPLHKLTKNDVLEICKRLSDGETQTSLAIEYGVMNTTISAIIVGDNWAWLTGFGPNG